MARVDSPPMGMIGDLNRLVRNRFVNRDRLVRLDLLERLELLELCSDLFRTAVASAINRLARKNQSILSHGPKSGLSRVRQV